MAATMVALRSFRFFKAPRRCLAQVSRNSSYDFAMPASCIGDGQVERASLAINCYHGSSAYLLRPRGDAAIEEAGSHRSVRRRPGLQDRRQACGCAVQFEEGRIWQRHSDRSRSEPGVCEQGRRGPRPNLRNSALVLEAQSRMSQAPPDRLSPRGRRPEPYQVVRHARAGSDHRFQDRLSAALRLS